MHNAAMATLMALQLTRDSVCAGDDADAPHERSYAVAPGAGWADVLQGIAACGYLASIAGGQATWVARVEGTPVAVLAQQWDAPRMLPGQERHAVQVAVRLHFDYCAQQDPLAVYAALRRP